MSKQSIIVLTLVCILLIYSVFIEPFSIKVTRYKVECPALSGVRAVFLSDLHLANNETKRLDKILKLTEKETPDILFLGGDFAKYADKKKKKKNMPIYNIATKIKWIGVPTYAVLGDMDEAVIQAENSSKNSKEDETRKTLRNAGIRVLDNTPIRVFLKSKSRYLDVIGVKDVSTNDVDVVKAMRRTRLPRIILSHNPDIYYDVLDDVTLILAGHTHGGQFVIPTVPPLFVPSKYGAKFASGYKIPKNNPIIISKGLGTDKVQFRFNCQPEIIVIDFIK